MTRKRYYFNQLSEGNVVYPLVQTAKDTLQHNECVVKTYQKYNDVLYGQSPRETLFMMGLDNQLHFSRGLVNSLTCPHHGRVSSSPETSKQVPSTLLKRYPSVSRMHLPLDSANNEASTNETTSREKLSTMDDKANFRPVKDVNAFSPVKRCKDSGELVTNDQGYVNSDEITKMLASSDEQNRRNIIPNRGSKVIKNFEERRNSPSPSKDAMLFRSMPRFIHSSGTVEIETDISIETVEIPTTTTLFSPVDCKSTRTITDCNGKKRSPKDMHFVMNESKAGIWRDFSLSPESTLTSSPIVEKMNDCSCLQVDVMNPEKHVLSCEASKGSLRTTHSLETASSPSINNSEPYEARYSIKKLYSLLQFVNEKLRNLLIYLIDFQNYLKFLHDFMQNIQYVGQNVLANKNCIKPTEGQRKNISGLATEASKLAEKIVSMEMEVDQEIPILVEYFGEIRQLKSVNEPLMYNGQPLVPLVFLPKYEDELIRILQKVEDRIHTKDSRIKLFLTTSQDAVKLINLFAKFLVNIGILKPSPASML